MDIYDKLYVLSSFIIQVCLVIYFASRKWNFDFSMRWGWTIYALGLPAVLVSLVLIMGGKPWYLWIAGFLYAAWAGFGYYVDIARPIDWRTPSLFTSFPSIYIAISLQLDVLLVADGDHSTPILVCLYGFVRG